MPDLPPTASELAALQREVEGLMAALQSRALIEQAKGACMARYGIDEDQAFRVLVRWSSLSNVPLRVVARTVLDLLSRTPASPVDEREFDAAMKGALGR